MKRVFLSAALALTVCSALAQSKYNHYEAFNPHFYPSTGTEYRSASGEPGPRYWQNRADYRIDVALDTQQHRVSGTVTITYSNNSPNALSFLWLQLDQNIYQQESRGSATTTQAGGRWANAGFTGGYTIRSVALEGNKVAPKYTITDTRMQLFLPQPLAGGAKISFTIGYEFTIPERGTDRMGRMRSRNGTIYAVAQWFPRMAVYDDVQGWNALPYLGAGEFYLEYGHADFSITAPAGMVVVGSGSLQNEKEVLTPVQQQRLAEARNSDKTVTLRSAQEVTQPASAGAANRTWRFRIENTRDAAWAASRAFVWDAARINLPSGKKALAMSAYPVESIKKDGWQRSTEFTKASIEHYSKQWFEYPYPSAVNVACNVSGMEYPGIVFCGYTDSGAELWNVTDHEFGHTWFPMIVGSNERRFAWMDEGFNTFINDLSTREFNKGEFAEASYIGAGDQMTAYVFGDRMDPLWTAPDVVQQGNLGVTAYFKPALMLAALRDVVLGPERFDRAFRTYIERWAFRHPTPWDFFRTMENVAGEDLSWFWRAWVFYNWKLDQAVTGVKYRNNDPSNGASITLQNLDQMVMPVPLLIRESNGKTHRMTLPVEVWQRGGSWTFQIPSTSTLAEVILDPDKKLPDTNRANNTWKP